MSSSISSSSFPSIPPFDFSLVKENAQASKGSSSIPIESSAPQSFVPLNSNSSLSFLPSFQLPTFDFSFPTNKENVQTNKIESSTPPSLTPLTHFTNNNSISSLIQSIAIPKLAELGIGLRVKEIIAQVDMTAPWQFNWRQAENLRLEVFRSSLDSVEKENNFNLLKALTDQKPGAIIYDAPLDKIGRIRSPDSDNSPYIALMISLRLIESNLREQDLWQEAIITPEDLRNTALLWMKDHYDTDELLRNFITGSIQDYLFYAQSTVNKQIKFFGCFYFDNADDIDPEEANRLSKEADAEFIEIKKTKKFILDNLNDPENYFMLVSQSAHFISLAELYAISEIFKLPIKVTRQPTASVGLATIDIYDPNKTKEINTNYDGQMLHLMINRTKEKRPYSSFEDQFSCFLESRDIRGNSHLYSSSSLFILKEDSLYPRLNDTALQSSSSSSSSSLLLSQNDEHEEKPTNKKRTFEEEQKKAARIKFLEE